jgi:AcrR family transcriptional regulator
MSKADLTKRALSEALSEQLKEKPFEQITVTDIARKAGLNRQTFYYHFRDLYDLIAFSVKQRIRLSFGVGITGTAAVPHRHHPCDHIHSHYTHSLSLFRIL